MEYYNSSKKIVKSINGWEEIFVKNGNKARHWKKGRSAFELANFMLNKNGENIIKQFLEKTLNEQINFLKGHIEYEVKFDEYNHGREHDLGIWGNTNSGKTIFVGIEAKVDELFGSTIKEAYIKNKVKELNGEKTNAIKRIENLLKKNFKKVTEKQFEIRYQLIYSTVGTIDADKNKSENFIPIFLIVVFKSTSYDTDKGLANKKDFHSFIKEIGALKIVKNNDKEMYKAIIDGKELYIGHLTIGY